MTDRERVMKSLTWDNPNSMPVEAGFSQDTWHKYRDALVPLAKRLPNDFGVFHAPTSYDEYEPGCSAGEIFVDTWGCSWENKVDGIMGVVTKHPLADWSHWDHYKYPDPKTTCDLVPWDQKGLERQLKENAKHGKFNYVICERLWERLHFVRGYENAMMDMAWGDARIIKLIDDIVEYNIASADKLLAYDDIDCLIFGDDWGEQNRLMISPAMWREYFFKGYKRIFDHVKKKGKYIYFHTDGFLIDIIPGFIEAGVDIINLQSRANSLDKLREYCLGKVCVSVDLDRQFVMPFGSTQDCRNHVQEVYDTMEAAKGGVWVKMHVYQDTPLENIEALVSALEDHHR